MIGAKRLVAWIVASLVLGACASVHNPDLRDQRVPKKSLREFVPSRPVTLTNGADPDLGDRPLSRSYYNAVEGDLWKWTESAIDLARREIEARGGNANGGGENELILEVSNVELETGQWNLRGIVQLRVQYGDHRTKTFTANVATSRGADVVLDAALRIAVGKMLSDPEIRKLL